jgi:glycosyl transferase family 87
MMKSASRIALAIWAAASFSIAASVLVIQLRRGSAGFDLFIQQWPLTNLPITLASVSLTWLLLGAFLYFLQAGAINESNVLTFSGFFLVAGVYLNSLNDHYRYGDYAYYQEAAMSLVKNRHLPDTYFYPPLWATLLKPLASLQTNTFLLVLWLANFVSLLVFFVLLHAVLQKYGFSPRLSALVTTLFLLVNTPLLRTLDYVQVNIHVLNLVFGSILLFQRRPFLSALMLAFAIHLKTSPAVLVLGFLLEKDWRWLSWLVLSTVLVGAITLATNGLMPFVDFLHNAQVLSAPRDAIFHDTSFDSFLGFAGSFLHVGAAVIRILVYACKALLAAAVLFVMARGVRNRTFLESKERGMRMLNALPPLFILMTLASPVVWEHHGLFLGLSFLLLLKRIDLSSEWLWFGFAYFLEFVLPTFDFFPWSYGRLVAPLIALWLMWRATKRQGTSPLFISINDWLSRLPALGI